MAATDPTPTILDLSSDDVLHLFRAEARRRVAEQLASGQAAYSSGIGTEAGRLYVHTPDGRLIEYRVAPDGQRTFLGDLASWMKIRRSR